MTAGDTLTLPPGGPAGITASAFDTFTGTLTLSGTDTLAHYQQALRSITYDASGAATSPPNRVVTFTVTDDHAAPSNTQSRTITINHVNQAPTAFGDTAAFGEDDPQSEITVLTNDTDPDLDTLHVASIDTTGTTGGVVLDGTGRVLYTAAGHFNGLAAGQQATDTFTYKNTDGSLLSNSATVTVTITGVDDPSVAVADTPTVTEDTPANINVRANDTDPDTAVENVASVTQPANGAVTNNGTDVTYAPNSNYCNSQVGGTADTFTYTLTGGSTATVSVTVTCVDDPPVAVNDSKSLTEDDPATAIDVLANDTDIDGGPKSVASVVQPANGTVVITGGGTGLTYKPNADYCNNPPDTSPDTFTYTLTPGGSSATVTVHVLCVNDAPVAGDDTVTAAQAAVGNTALVVDAPGDGPPSASGPHKSISVDILANDTDVDSAHANLTVSTSGTSHDGGTVVMQSDGDFVYTPAAATSCSDHSDFFTYTVSDNDPSSPQTDTGQVNIDITGCVWYVNNNASGDAGTSTAPFDTLAEAQTASGMARRSSSRTATTRRPATTQASRSSPASH